jgi:RNA 3'-terminal phosphate cyclase
MVESVDRYGIEHTCLEVLEIQKLQPGFAESELRAAKAMLRLLEFDAELNPAEAEESAGTGVGAALRTYSEDDEEGEVRMKCFGVFAPLVCVGSQLLVCLLL